jgi:hypothetical protein
MMSSISQLMLRDGDTKAYVSAVASGAKPTAAVAIHSPASAIFLILFFIVSPSMSVAVAGLPEASASC